MAVESRLSVIIPAFNAAQTLRSCVASILDQDIEDMEIIIIDDGSTDNTAMLADSLSHTQNNIKVIHQINKGLSAARNSGIDSAQGAFITFVDSDDQLAPNTYANVLKLFDDRPSCDIVEYSVVCKREEKILSRLTLDDNIYTNGYDYWFAAKGYAHCYAWNKVFRRHVFLPKKNDPPLRFIVGYTFEDIYLMAELLHRNPTITTTSQGTYIYQQNTRGITATAGATAMQHLLNVHLQVVDECSLATKQLTYDEEEYYLSVLNIQITLCQLSGQTPSLPTCHLSLRWCDCRHWQRLVKKILLNLCGITMLCRLCHRIS